MASATQTAAARKNIRKAAAAAKKKKTIAHLPKKVRTAWGKRGLLPRVKRRNRSRCAATGPCRSPPELSF